MPTKRINYGKRSALSTEQKIAFVLLMFLGLGGVFFGFQSFGASMTRPIQIQIAKYAKGERILTTDEREQKEMEESKKRDTDGDTLMDYDELYVYKTSPYLADSDSDGFADSEEIFSGNDPNCPVGKGCGVVAAGTDESTGSNILVQNLIAPYGGSDSVLAAGSVKIETPEDIENYFRSLTNQQLRQALLQSGVTQEELDQIDDETLQSYFGGALDTLTNTGAFSELNESLSETEETVDAATE